MSEPEDRRSSDVPPWDPGAGSTDRPATGGWQAPTPTPTPTSSTSPPPGPTGPPGPPGPTPPRDPWGFGGPVAAPRPGIVPLRPLALGEVLDGAFQYIRAHPRVVLGVSAVVAVITTLIQAPFQATYGESLEPFTAPGAAEPDLDALAGVLGGASALLGVSAVVGLLANTVLTGLLVVVLSRAVLGAPVDARECWNAARPRLPGLLGVVLLVALATIAAFAVLLVPAGLVALVGGPSGVAVALAVLGTLLGAAAAIVVGVLLALAAPAYVLEGIGVTAALARSRRLVTGRFWPVLGILLLGTIIVAIVSGLVGVPFGLAATGVAVATGTSPYATLPLLVSSVGTVIGVTLTAPFQAGVTGLLYVDQRMRREGFDLELQRAARS
ncbi:hypothetical protein WCD74_27895 [Actinomycetospora sp. OC33-EN08]|uniref:Glycerophosphoryl diester phosphodiesterase membrane domain-containing protein n=1 Tax=Actinomycetospora aurantiaca TaxID=3129233 RepID=A0ABU8MWC1_9PSEU